MSKPVCLIVTNRMHEAAEEAERLKAIPVLDAKLVEEKLASDTFADGLARALLCRISHEAGPSVVLKALAAAGAPCSFAEIMAQFAAVREARAREAGAATKAEPAATAAEPQP